MSKIVLPRGHIFLSSCTDMQQICKGLFNSTPISYFAYSRRYDNGEVIEFSTNNQWFAHAWENNVFTTYVMMEAIQQKYRENDTQNGCWYLVSEENLRAELNANQFNLRGIFSGIHKKDNYYEKCTFGAFGKNIISYFMNHKTVLENFWLYFLEQAEALINLGYKNRINILGNNKHNKENNSHSLSVLDFCAFQPVIKLQSYPVKVGNTTSYLTKREFECLSLLAHGQTIKTAANTLNLSPRTVEQFLNNMKFRLGIYSRLQLIDLYFANHFDTIYISSQKK